MYFLQVSGYCLKKAIYEGICSTVGTGSNSMDCLDYKIFVCLWTVFTIDAHSISLSK